MDATPTLTIAGQEQAEPGTVPAPVPPDDPEAWYAEDVRAQYEPMPGVVATVTETATGFAYDTREPPLDAGDKAALASVREHFSAVRHRRPLTRQGVVERAVAGFEPKYERALDRLLDTSAAARRRIDYHALSELRLLGDVTPLAVDDRIEVADVGDEEELVVHTDAFAPVRTDVDAGADYVERVAGERLRTYEVAFFDFDVEVVVYREHLLGSDQFTTKYAVLEPDLLPGDEALIEECKERIWEGNVDHVVEDRRTFVADRARQFLSRRLTARNTRAWIDATRYRLRAALAEYDLVVPPVDSRFARDRLDDLVYYVLRDYVGEGILSVPIRDPHLEDIEANRVNERVKVVPRASIYDGSHVADDDTHGTGVDDARVASPGDRVPTNLSFESETTFVNVVTQLAAHDGTELNAAEPSAKVNVDLEDVPETVRCAVALPVISEGGPYVSIRKQSPDVMTPVDLVERDSLSTELVALFWLLYEHHGVVLISGPTGVGKTTLMNAHMPFVPFDDRPISIDEGSREVRLPHETGVSLTTRDHENDYKRVTMAELMTETNYLNPDVEVIAEINTPESFETFAETLNTGHGVVGTTHAEDVETLVNRVIEQGLPAYLLHELDLVAFPHEVDGDRYVSHVVELLSDAEFEALPDAARDSDGSLARRGGAGTVEKDGATIHWNTVGWRDTDGTFHLEYDHPALGDEVGGAGATTDATADATTDATADATTDATADATTDATADATSTAPNASDELEGDLRFRFLHRVAERTDRDVTSVEDEFHRKHRYVRYLVNEGVSDFDDLFEFLADLRTDEAATVERAVRTTERSGTAVGPGAAGATDGGSHSSTDASGTHSARSGDGGDET